MRRRLISTVLPVVVFLIGLGLLLYPWISDAWNSMHQSRAIVEYSEQVESLDPAVYDRIWEEARSYNESLLQNSFRFNMTDEETEEYESLLNIAGDGIMGYVEIPAIEVSIPIYHGTGEQILQVAAGHLEGSSLPTGGAGTHCVLTGHRGLPSAKLFTDLDELKEGDRFSLNVLNETLTYEVDQILITEPEDMSALEIDPEEDYCTLVTCTPYGINTHRLLVRGHRVEAEETSAVEAAEPAAEQKREIPVVLILLLIVILAFISWQVYRLKIRAARRSKKK